MVSQCIKSSGSPAVRQGSRLCLSLYDGLFGCRLLGGDLLKPFEHAKHHTHGGEGYEHEDEPAHPQLGHLVEEERTNHDEEVAYGRGAEPETLADALNVLGGNLADEAQTQRADEELGNGEEEIGYNKHPGAALGQTGGYILCEVVGAVGIANGIAKEGEEEVGAYHKAHAEGNLARGGELAAPVGAEEPHDDGGEEYHEGGVEELPHLGSHLVGVDKVAGEERERLAVLVECHPEEDADAEHCIEAGHALLDVFGHGGALVGGVFFLCCSVAGGGSGFLLRVGHAALGGEEDDKRDEHGGDRCEERVVHTGVEDVDVAHAGLVHVGEVKAAVVDLGHEGVEVAELLGSHSGGVGKVLVAESGEVGVVGHAFKAEPPAAQRGGHKGGEHATDVDEDVEDLEARVAFALGLGESLGAFLGCLGFEVVVHLAYQGLQVAFEEAVAEGDDKQSRAGEHEDAYLRRGVLEESHEGDGEHYVAGGHGEEASLDGAFVVLQLVGDNTAGQAQHVDGEVEYRIDDGCGLVGDAELGAEEQQ